MCLAIPGKVIERSGEHATIDYDGIAREANISLLPGAKTGDFVLVHAGFAIQIVDKATAESANKLIQEFGDA